MHSLKKSPTLWDFNIASRNSLSRRYSVSSIKTSVSGPVKRRSVIRKRRPVNKKSPSLPDIRRKRVGSLKGSWTNSKSSLKSNKTSKSTRNSIANILGKNSGFEYFWGSNDSPRGSISKTVSKKSLKSRKSSVRPKNIPTPEFYIGPLKTKKLKKSERNQLIELAYRRLAAKTGPLNSFDLNLILRNKGLPGYSQDKKEYDDIIKIVNTGKNIPLMEKASMAIKKDKNALRTKILVGMVATKNIIEKFKNVA